MKKKTYDEVLLENIRLAKEKKVLSEKQSDDKNLAVNLLAISDALDQYYFLNKLRVYNTFLSYKEIFKSTSIQCSPADFKLIPEIIQSINVLEQASSPITITDNINKLFNPTKLNPLQLDQLFTQTLNLTNESSSLHSIEERLEIYSFLNNYSIQKMNNGHHEYRPIFILINIQILKLKNQEIKPKNLRLPPRLFKNIVIVGLLIDDPSFFTHLKTPGLKTELPMTIFRDKFEWVEKFIQFYGNKLGDTTEAKSYLIYCRATLEFCRQNFTEAYEIFNNSIRIQGTFINLGSKLLHLKILFEINIQKAILLEYDKIEIRQVLDAYRKLIKYEVEKKQKISYHISFYSNFEKVYKQLLNHYYDYFGRKDNHKNDRFLTKKREIEQLIKANNHSYNDWLLEKLNNIK